MQDSIYVEPPSIVALDLVPRTPAKPQTPYQVLRLLPKDATPAQQDSAIQAWFAPDEIHYSERPDTLHLPGEGIPRDLKDVKLPTYYRENFFSNDSLYHPELNGGRYGVAGDPVPETLRNDSLISGLLILCFLVMTFAFARISGFIGRQIKDFFYVQKGEHSVAETGDEINIQIVFSVITCLTCSLLYYLYVTTEVDDTFIFSTEHMLLGVIFLVMAGYFLSKFLLYTIVNHIMFDGTKNKKFLTLLIFLISMEGVLLFPVLLLRAYFQFPMQNAAIYAFIVVLLIKILTFYKTYVIFFAQKALYMQIILYFCALEMVPLLSLWGGLAVIVNHLRVIF
ncbi:MAG: DUF4271 domain-containing protein [Prevotella sp.]|nr:DUF4271 domain-containing protein [Prevotella sp.]